MTEASSLNKEAPGIKLDRKLLHTRHGHNRHSDLDNGIQHSAAPSIHCATERESMGSRGHAGRRRLRVSQIVHSPAANAGPVQLQNFISAGSFSRPPQVWGGCSLQPSCDECKHCPTHCPRGCKKNAATQTQNRSQPQKTPNVQPEKC